MKKTIIFGICILVLFLFGCTGNEFDTWKDSVPINGGMINAPAKNLALQLPDMPVGYRLTEEKELSIYEGSEEIVRNNVENELKSKYGVKYEYGKKQEGYSEIEFTELVNIYSKEGIAKQWKFEINDIEEAIKLNDEYTQISYFSSPTIGDSTIGLVISDITGRDLYSLKYRYKNILVHLGLTADEKPAEKIVDLAKLSLEKIKKSI